MTTAELVTGSRAHPRAPVKRFAILAVSLGVLVLVCVISLGIGARVTELSTVLRAVIEPDGSAAHVIIREVRIPRALLGVGVGAALGVSGALIQTLSRNPLAEPGILGVTSGAGFALTVGSAGGLAGSVFGELGLAVVGAVLATILVYAVGRRSTLRLLLAGVAFSAVLSGMSLGMRLMLPETFDQYRFWAVGSLAGREQTPLTVPLLAIALALIGALLVSRALNAVSLGDAVARTLGANVARIRGFALVIITVLAGAATAVAGPILFVGLVIPHLVRRLAVGSVPWLVAFSMVLGPIVLVAADTVSRVLLPTGEVPVAIVTAFLGAPMLIWAVRRYGAGSL